MAGHLADEIAVMECGKIVELGAAEKVLGHPEQEITRRLIVAIPRLGTMWPSMPLAGRRKSWESMSPALGMATAKPKGTYGGRLCT
jgi:ABC-type glutathione transport system ATPase component